MYENFSKFYGKVGVITWFLFHLIWKNYVLYWDFDLKSWIVDFFTHFTREKTPQNNFSSQNFSVENNYFFITNIIFYFLSYLKLEWFARLYHLCTSNLYDSIPTPNPSRSLYYYTTTNAFNQCTVVENYLSSRSLWPLIYPLPTSKTTTYPSAG